MLWSCLKRVQYKIIAHNLYISLYNLLDKCVIVGYKGTQRNGGKQHTVGLAWHLHRPAVAFQGTNVSVDSLAFFIDRGWKQVNKNQLKKIRESLLMSKAELARKAGVSPITIDRIEKGMDCRMETKRKILLALGYKLSEKDTLFPG